MQDGRGEMFEGIILLIAFVVRTHGIPQGVVSWWISLEPRNRLRHKMEAMASVSYLLDTKGAPFLDL